VQGPASALRGMALHADGVPREGRPTLDGYWRARFEADPLLRMMFAKAYATYVARLRERPAGA